MFYLSQKFKMGNKNDVTFELTTFASEKHDGRLHCRPIPADGSDNVFARSEKLHKIFFFKNCLETDAAGQISSETSSLVLLMRCLTFQIKTLIGVSVLLIVSCLHIEFCLAAVLPDRFWL